MGAGPRLGQLLSRDYVAIGAAYAEGKWGWQAERKPAECGAVGREPAQLGPSAFLLDVRSASGTPAHRWLNSVSVMRADNPKWIFA